MSQNYSYPSSSVTISGIGNPTGVAVPNNAVYIAGDNPSGILTGIQVDASGRIIVSPSTSSSTVTVVQPTGTNLHAVIDASALPTGAATAANQSTEIAALGTISLQLPTTLGPQLTANSLSVNIASDQIVSTIDNDFTASGNITTQNLVPTGTATAGSAVAISCNNKGTVTIQVNGTYTGALTPQVTTDGVNWVTQVGNSLLNMGNGANSNTILSGATGIWQIEANGHAQFRITALAAVTGTAAISLRAAQGTSQVTISGTLPLPNGAATSTLQTTGNTALATINTTLGSPFQAGGSIGNTTFAVTQATASSLNATVVQPTAANLNATIVGVGTAGTPSGGVVTVQGSAAGTSLNVTQGGRSKSNAPVYNVYSSTNVTTSAYVQLVASTTSVTNMIEIFDSSGQSMIIGVGASGSEVVQLYTLPGGNGQVPLAIPAGSRVAIKALTASATSGYLTINFYS